MTLTRRDFLTRSLAGSTILATGATLPGFLAHTARASAGFGPGRERILVVVEMNGGNDGLNTVIPFRADDYYRARPTIALPRPDVLTLDDHLALHPAMRAFARLHERGWLAVCENVGYPNPDRSHFRSMDIWQSASPCPEESRTGWLGRAVDRSERVDTPLALHLDGTALPAALRTTTRAVPSIEAIDAFRLDGDADAIERAASADRADASADLQFVQRTAVSSCRQARRLAALGVDPDAAARYPAHGLANRLAQIARLIGAEFGPRVYYTSMGGFDTHARQLATHASLLTELAESIGAFFADLEARRLHERVVVMTFSEFGRRVDENGSQGTDHGAAAPMFVAGPGVRGGIVGGVPDLADLGRGDLKHHVDFRSVYASVLDDWLGIPSRAILGASFPGLPILRS